MLSKFGEIIANTLKLKGIEVGLEKERKSPLTIQDVSLILLQEDFPERGGGLTVLAHCVRSRHLTWSPCIKPQTCHLLPPHWLISMQ